MMEDDTMRSLARAAGSDVVPPDVERILDNLVELDRMLDEGSRRELDALPYLELSKHLKIRNGTDR